MDKSKTTLDKKPQPPLMEVHTVSQFDLDAHTITIFMARVPEEELQAILGVIERVRQIVKAKNGKFTNFQQDH